MVKMMVIKKIDESPKNLVKIKERVKWIK